MKINDKLIKRKIVNASRITFLSTTSNAVITFNKLNIDTSKITYNNGTFTIGEGVSKVLISANFMARYTATNNQTYGFGIFKNDEEVTSGRCYKQSNNPIGCSVPNYLLDVDNGDTITMKFATSYTSGATDIAIGTFITIEIVE